MSVSVIDLKKKACDAIDAVAEKLNSVSQEIWKNPELNYEEHHAHKVLTEFLKKEGFPVEQNYVVDTAFRSIIDHGEGSGPTAAVLCEYDALPGIGHACGHNLIAECGIGAAVGIKAAMDAAKQAGQQTGKLHVVGTPAEEGGGGKIVLIEAGVFKTVDFAMMCHPTPFTLVDCSQHIICIKHCVVKYHGKASHAAAFPWEGVNALDAAVMAYTSISAMRQQMKPSWRVHGIISNGGTKPNIIPEEAELTYNIRAPTKKEIDELHSRVIQCFEASAKATGCTVDITWTPNTFYLNMISNKQLGDMFEQNALSLGVKFTEDMASTLSMVGSTDMGNVSYEVPSIHPMYGIGGKGLNHTRDFTDDTGSVKAQSYTIAQAKAMAMTVIDMFCQPEMVKKMKESFQADISESMAA